MKFEPSKISNKKIEIIISNTIESIVKVWGLIGGKFIKIKE